MYTEHRDVFEINKRERTGDRVGEGVVLEILELNEIWCQVSSRLNIIMIIIIMFYMNQSE